MTGLHAGLVVATGATSNEREVVSHSRGEAAQVLPWVHVLIGNLKTWLRGTYHGVSAKHLPAYVKEFIYRFNRRFNEADIFRRMLGRATFAGPLTYRELVAEAGA